ncbi:MAG: ribose-5-phosphate isomerase RpiA [Pseudomonadota bacterium]|nr:ribose-5-phosphate isomerase RpiA [Pseudomonadota bacterium]
MSDALKQKAAEAALSFVTNGTRLGVGTGSTVKFFIDALAAAKVELDVIVSSSEQSTKHLESLGFTVTPLNQAGNLDLYVDGADEINERLEMIKGGGGALTREKIIAGASDRFVCIVDSSKKVKQLGKFPLPIEVIPMARSFVARKIIGLGGQPEYREGVITDNGNEILDVYNLDIAVAAQLEEKLNQIPGVVTNGLFALRPADVALVAHDGQVITHTR